MEINSLLKIATSASQCTQDNFLEKCSYLAEESINFTSQLSEKINGKKHSERKD